MFFYVCVHILCISPTRSGSLRMGAWRSARSLPRTAHSHEMGEKAHETNLNHSSLILSSRVLKVT